MSVTAMDSNSRGGNNEIDLREKMPHDLKSLKCKLKKSSFPLYLFLSPSLTCTTIHVFPQPSASCHSLSLSVFLSGNLILKSDVLTLQIPGVATDQEAREMLTYIHTHLHTDKQSVRRTKRESDNRGQKDKKQHTFIQTHTLSLVHTHMHMQEPPYWV